VIYQIFVEEPPPPKIAFQTRIAARKDAGAGLLLVALEPPASAAAAHLRPGQYVWLGAWFVLASAPGHSNWEVVLRPAGDAAIKLATAPIGTAIDAAGPFGEGFPMAIGEALVIAATGGAIAAVRAIMDCRIEHGDAKSTQLFLGVRTRAELPLQDEVAEWTKAGADVVICISSEDARVQDVARKRMNAPAGTTLLLAGHPGMIDAMKALAAERGLVAHVNY
jgi:NAD(P)H-flavin reductase